MAAGGTFGLTNLSCLVIYHPEDYDEADRLLGIITGAGYECRLFFECSGTNTITEIFRLTTESAVCVISLITKRLLSDKQQFMYHQKVYHQLCGERFIPVIRNISDQQLKNDINLGFLGGCQILRATSWSDDNFIKRFVNLIKTTLANSVPHRTSNVTEGDRRADVHRVERSRINHPPAPCGQMETLNMSRPVSRKPTPSYFVGDRPSTSTGITPGSVLTGGVSEPVCAEDAPSLTACENGSDDYVQQQDVNDLETTQHEEPTQIHRNYEGRSQTSETSPGSPVQEENKDKCLGKGSSGEVFLVGGYTFSDGTAINIPVALKILHLHDKSVKHFNREKALARLRYPFLLPILEVIDRPGDRYQLITPYMENRNLEEMLGSRQLHTRVTDLRSSYLLIIYQISRAIDFLHRRGFVHGDIHPCNILLDKFGNARLADYGLSVYINQATEENESDEKFQARYGYADPYTKNDGAKSVHTDEFSFGITLLQMLKYRPSFGEYTTTDRRLHLPLYEILRRDNNDKLPTTECLLTDERYVDRDVWPTDRTSKKIVEAILNLLSPYGFVRTDTLMNLIAFMKFAVIQQARRPLITLPPDRCAYCYVGNPNRDLQLKAPSCQSTCEFLKMCHTCWTTAFSYGPIVCPKHNGCIYAPVGGQRACALIISGRDEDDPDAQENFSNDAKAIERVVEHPRILCVPRRNIYHISPCENFTRKNISEVIEKIVSFNPDFFLFYYSGHYDDASTQLDVSDAQGKSLDIDEIQRTLLNPLFNSPRVLVMLDCCCAASMNLLPAPASGTSDSHVRWHVQWSSCGRREESNIEPGDTHSLFTKFAIIFLTGARRCPNGNAECVTCSNFRETCDRKKFISVEEIDKCLNEHMSKRRCDDRKDVQNPLIQTIRREEPVIAYYTGQPLYRFNVDMPYAPSGGDPCCLDTLDDSIVDVLQQLWNSLRNEGRLPNYIDHRALQICYRTGKKSRPLNDVGEIVDVVHEDKHSLYVAIRMDGNELDVENWVACTCDRSEAESLMRKLSPAGSQNVCETATVGNSEATVWQIRELDLDSLRRSVGLFCAVLGQCWQKYLRLHQEKFVTDEDYMRVEICDGLTMFNIELVDSEQIA